MSVAESSMAQALKPLKGLKRFEVFIEDRFGEPQIEKTVMGQDYDAEALGKPPYEDLWASWELVVIDHSA